MGCDAPAARRLVARDREAARYLGADARALVGAARARRREDGDAARRRDRRAADRDGDLGVAKWTPDRGRCDRRRDRDLAGRRVILGTSRVVRVFAYPAATDLRKGY